MLVVLVYNIYEMKTIEIPQQMLNISEDWKPACYYPYIVDNDKIDESKIEIHWFSFYESMLMQLAIQDEPI